MDTYLAIYNMILWKKYFLKNNFNFQSIQKNYFLSLLYYVNYKI